LKLYRTTKTDDRLPNFELGKLGFEDDKLAVMKFVNWFVNKPEWWVLVEREGSSGRKYFKRDFKWFRVYNRFDKPYIKRVIRRFETARSIAENMSFVHIELTVDRSESICRSIRKLYKYWNNLRSFLKKRLGRNYPYFSKIEPHKDGYPHLHIFYFCPKFLIKQELLSEWCREHGLGKVVWLKRYWAKGCRKKPLYYLTKYLTKQFKVKKWSWGEGVFYACMWFMNAKSYTFSQGFLPRKRKSGRWICMYVGSYEGIMHIVSVNVKIGIYCMCLPLWFFELDIRDRVLWWVDRLENE
jgi:hypothetical protein